jgi:hypothetical protein
MTSSKRQKKRLLCAAQKRYNGENLKRELLGWLMDRFVDGRMAGPFRFLRSEEVSIVSWIGEGDHDLKSQLAETMRWNWWICCRSWLQIGIAPS